MAEGDRERWDATYSSGRHTRDPDLRWLLELDRALPSAGRALDVAAGTGGVARFWAARGLESLAVDVSPVALSLAREEARRDYLELETLELDLEIDSLPAGPFAAISCFHYLQRDLFPQLRERLTPGGVIACEIATVQNLERHAKPSARFLLQPDELRELLAGLELVSYAEGWRDDRFTARALARRSAGAAPQ